MCLKRYLDVHNSTWTVFLDSYLAEFGGAFLTNIITISAGNFIRSHQLPLLLYWDPGYAKQFSQVPWSVRLYFPHLLQKLMLTF